MLRQTSNLPSVRTPSKQGAFYQLKLGKNNGPFLSKDIMFSNKKSMTLLTNKQILKSHETMVNTIKGLQENQKDMGQFSSMSFQGKYQNSHKRLLNERAFKNQQSNSCVGVEKIENFHGTYAYCQKQLKVCDAISSSLKVDMQSLEIDLSSMHGRISANITNLFESSMPGLKIFLKKVKQTNITDKEENYQLKRDLQNMEMMTKVLRKGLTECQNKIQSLEMVFNQKIGDRCLQDEYTQDPTNSRGYKHHNDEPSDHSGMNVHYGEDASSFISQNRQLEDSQNSSDCGNGFDGHRM